MKSAFIELFKNLAKLIDVKSIVTITLIAVLSYITLKQMPVPDLFSNSVMLVLGFFFGKNVAIKESDEK